MIALFELCAIQKPELCSWLSRFIFEIHEEDGGENSEISIHNIACGLLHYISYLAFHDDLTFCTPNTHILYGCGQKKEQEKRRKRRPIAEIKAVTTGWVD